MENWKTIEGFENYEVSDLGRIRELEGQYKGNIIHSNKSGKGYVGVTLNGKPIRVHQLVAKAFVLENNHLPLVNHEDGNKKNNKASNLVWSTYSKNLQHAYDNGLRRQKTDGTNSNCVSIMQIDNEGRVVAKYPGVRVAERTTGIKCISAVIVGRRKQAGGYYWKKE